ncbi:uncharacterized protein TRAVEDRAFT_22542 [Trametes versicolor FP-101664 SS1]|uniref:uncharacterized protein n=1 Tax=Trametes versicolor (strain FP-101664) TaxID=717944 RepID=UPI0004622C8D|nr:uncharacterized protein TRAVEDRAFT_22542 [Trametes versicolor FP-101664 SS1]EIW56233.1 hypothetical protein TRAVEDRAFT_22542 [Trametes versicolor FP-101664 SS1]
MTSIGNNANNAGDPSTNNSSSGNSHRKLKGAAEVVHGIGENIRGRLMDVVDSSTNSEAAHPEVEEGGHEIEHGMARLTGGPGVENPRRTRVSDETSTKSSVPSLAQEGNVLGPASGVPTGLKAGPQYSSPGAADDSAAPVQGGRNDRDFHPGSADRAQEGGGPAPDRNALSRSPQRLA